MGGKSTLFQSKYEVKYTPALQGFREMKLYLSEKLCKSRSWMDRFGLKYGLQW